MSAGTAEEEFERQLKSEFLQEAEELLSQFEVLLLEVDHDNDNMPLVNNLFRIVHTVKGSGYTAGFETLSNFVHKTENLLSNIREGQVVLTVDLVDILLDAKDLTKDMVDELHNSPDNTIDTAEVEERIADVLKGASVVEAPAKSKPTMSFEIFGEEEEKPAPTPKETYRKSAEEQAEHLIHGALSGTVLICDDDETTREFFEENLQEEGYKILTAENGVHALEVLAKSHVDLVISDLKMPEMDGMELATKIRETDNKIPILFITGLASEFNMIDVVNLHVEGIVEKPFEMDVVYPKIKLCLKLKRIRDMVVTLSTVNFQAYMGMVKLLQGLKISTQQEQTKEKVEFHMDQIAKLMNAALEI